MTIIWSNGTVEVTVDVIDSSDAFSALLEKLKAARAMGITIYVDDFHIVTAY